MEGYIVIGLLIIAAVFLGIHIYRASSASGGCSCCGGLNNNKGCEQAEGEK